MSAPILLDVTRAVLRRLLGKSPSGIDRVCDAYARHFAGKALAVVQFQGRASILNDRDSERLLMSLDGPVSEVRRQLLRMLTRSLASPVDRARTSGSLYINVSHSDFDLDSHWQWIDRRRLRPIYLLHDLIPLTHPEVTTAHKSARHRARVIQALQGSAGIIVNSKSTSAELRYFAAKEGLDLPSVLTALIAGPLFPPGNPAERASDLAFVSVGTIETRKNHALLIEVWSRLIEGLGEATPRLVLAGSLGVGSEAITNMIARDKRLAQYVEIRSDLDDNELAKLVRNARALLLPSLAEGYGIPLVEALELGTPVIASDLPSFRELGQGIPTLLDPNEQQQWVQAVIDFCLRGPEFQRQSSRVVQFDAPTWKQHFSQLDSWLKQLDESSFPVIEPQVERAALA